jgi:hypothetical protein
MPTQQNFFVTIWKFRGFRIFSISLVSVLILLGLLLGGIRIATPYNIANPQIDHYHFRFQYIYHGTGENFSDSKYQTPYTKDICDGGITNSPVHFHDQKDQLVHIHWRGMTGGEFLKIYGVNTIGGVGGYLGARFDKLFNWPPHIIPVANFGDTLPKPQSDDTWYIYTGDATGYQKKTFEDFKTKTIEEFIGTDSTVRKQFEENEKSKTSLLNTINSIPVLAHNGVDDGDGPVDAVRSEEERLKQINNLIGNIVIFVQPKEPSAEEIKAKFDTLIPLSASSCGG